MFGPVTVLERVRAIVDEPRLDGDDERRSGFAGRRARPPDYPGYVSDLAEGQDLLGRRADVEALALLIAARETEPPLSIGLFGDWGTGKTFFIECLQREIRSLAPRDASIAICREVRQVVFNAWHYTDANLWASLVTQIFAELAEPRTGESRHEARERWRAERERLVGELESTRQQLTEAETRHRLARAEIGRLKDALADLERRRVQGRNTLATLKSVAGLVLSDPAVRGSLDEAERDLELRAGAELQQLRRLTDESTSTARRLSRLWQLLVPAKRDAIRWRLWVAGIAAAVLCVAVPVAVARFAPTAVQLLSGLVALLAPLALAGRSVLGALGRALRVAEQAADTAGEVERRLAEQRSTEVTLLAAADDESWADFVERSTPPGPMRQALEALNARLAAVVLVGALKAWVPVVGRYSFHTAPAG